MTESVPSGPRSRLPGSSDDGQLLDREPGVGRSWFEAIWESATDAMSLSDAEGRVVAANPAYYKLYGHPPEEVLGQSFACIFPENLRENAVDGYREYFGQGVDGTVENIAVVRSDGTQLCVDVRFNFVREDGKVMMLSVIRDMTHRAALLGAERALNVQKDTMLAAVAHDLRTPLTSIRGRAQLLLLLLRRDRPATRAELIDGLMEIENSTTRMARLTDEMLDAARMQLGKSLDLHLSDVDLVAVAESILRSYTAAFPDRSIVLQASDHPVGRWDGARLERVIDNLISNAVKYSEDNSDIVVSIDSNWHDGAMWARLSVADQGIGIAKEDQERLFEWFYRAETAKPGVQGSGIGLAGVRDIVEYHGGNINVESVKGEGTTFTIDLPMSPSMGSPSG